MPKLYSVQQDSNSSDDSPFVDRITALSIRHSRPIDLAPYFDLQALKLQSPTHQQCQQAMEQSQLEHLYIGRSQDPDYQAEIIKHIFANRFSRLRSCYVNSIGNFSFHMPDPSTILPMLSSIKLLTYYIHHLPLILSLCPNLIRFSIKFFLPEVSHVNTSRSRLSVTHQNLRALQLNTIFSLSIELIESFLQLVPNITYLTIVHPRCEDVNNDVKRIARSLQQLVPKLTQFRVIIWLEGSETTYLNNTEEIQSLHPLFEHVQISSVNEWLIISSSH